MAIRLIALDIDGTLLNSRWEVSRANSRAIHEATRRGIEVAIVTGRRYDFALPVVQQIDSPVTMMVNNGALVRTSDGKTHLRHLLPRETASLVLTATTPWRDCAAVVFDRPQENQVILESIDWSDPARGSYYTRNRKFLGEASPLESCLDEDPIQVMFTGAMEPMRQVEQTLMTTAFSGDFSVAVTVYPEKDFAMIDVIHPSVSKGAALAEWAGFRGIAPQEILAVGDNHNDLEMLSFAGIPVVMGNGVPELKARGWHVTRSNDDDGVAAAIHRFVLKETTE
jgi:Cof subfamily protein (haloacid dehalogenase superfamily)